MKPLFEFILKYLKLILTSAIVLFVLIFVTLLLYEQHKKNILLEKKVKKLQNLKMISVPSADQLYAESRVLIKDKIYDAALEKLLQLKSHYPYWHPQMVNSSINAVKRINNKLKEEQIKLEKKLNLIADADSNDIFIDTTGIRQTRRIAFQKFEYSDKNIPLRTSNSGYVRNPRPGNIRTNPDGSIIEAPNEFSFRKFEFEDERYKKKISPVTRSLSGRSGNSVKKDTVGSKKKAEAGN